MIDRFENGMYSVDMQSCYCLITILVLGHREFLLMDYLNPTNLKCTCFKYYINVQLF